MINARPSFNETDFRQSSRSDPTQDCGHVARQAGWVELRDSKTIFGGPGDRRLVLTAEPGRAFLGAVQAGRLDR